jgi:hypothetical protein
MVELSAACEGLAQRGLISQISFDQFVGQPLQILKVRSGAGYDADVDTSLHQRARHCAADESGCTCNENFHLEDVKRET